jgi:hypothetical protein
MNTVVPDADLYITMHTGVWIMLHPWGYIPDQPIDWELYHFIRDEVNTNISDIPIRNANEGLYPNSGTSRDYGYGIMGYPTFTFETDDEQWLLGTVEALSDRLGEELNVMRYLIDNVWSWRARLSVQSMTLDQGSLTLSVDNPARASTANVTLQYLDEAGQVVWNSTNFGVNATNSAALSLDASNLTVASGGTFALNYQVRVVESARWVNEPVLEVELNVVDQDETSFLIGYGLFNPVSLLACFIAVAAVANERENRNQSL